MTEQNGLLFIVNIYRLSAGMFKLANIAILF